MKNCCEYSSLHQTPSPPPTGESEDLNVLGDLQNFTITSTRTPPPTGQGEDLDVLGALENFTIASTRSPPPLPSEESEDLDVLGDLENFTTASTRTPLLSTTANFISGRVWIWRKPAHKSISRGYCGLHLMHTRCRYEDGAVAMGGHWFTMRWTYRHSRNVHKEIWTKNGRSKQV